MEKTEDAERREKNLQEAKKIVVEEDKSLPAPLTVSSTSDSISHGTVYFLFTYTNAMVYKSGKRIKKYFWVQFNWYNL